jgi:serine O-acetyltransferase
VRDFLLDLRSKQRLYSLYGPPRGLMHAVLADGTIANLLYRLQSHCAALRLAPIAFAIHLINKWLNGCVIGVRARFGGGLVLIHPIGVVINSSVVGGRNVWIESGVVIGDNRGGSPTIGNDVFIGSGAKVIGAVRIGDRARIGANAVVLKDVLADQTVVGIPARPVTSTSSVLT